jgi:hypothetical protein
MAEKNLQVLCTFCNSSKGEPPLKEEGIAA